DSSGSGSVVASVWCAPADDHAPARQHLHHAPGSILERWPTQASLLDGPADAALGELPCGLRTRPRLDRALHGHSRNRSQVELDPSIGAHADRMHGGGAAEPEWVSNVFVSA